MNTFKVVKSTDPYHARLYPEFPPHATEVTIEDNLSKEEALVVLEEWARDYANTRDNLMFVDVENNPDAREWVEAGEFDYEGPGVYDTDTHSAVWVRGQESFRYDTLTFSVEEA